ncbi:IucA/IucC family protein [Kineosporia succinea]|uniref:Siderophore synthetase component n=1 Tax=Kineosporia succinea TaxID=84632 RepID=A0ABT9P1Q5_9ACTN|nr:IucA/IucC family protein [Kineosporia succinea]MDP9826442.1 siderophore synthetase component [Kineosporia succinea]
MSAEAVTIIALLNCLVREVSGPAGLVTPDGADRVTIRLEKSDRTLSAGLLRPMGNVSRETMQPRFSGQVESGEKPLSWREVLELVDAELTAITGATAEHLTGQIAISNGLIAEALRRPVPEPSPHPYLDLEQSLLAGHRYHPAPKARSGSVGEIRRYAPELGARFQLHHLAVRSELVREIGAEPDHDQAPSGYRLLPLHPWQYAILSRGRELPAALGDGRAIDLGPSGPMMRPTSSVRTVAADDTGFVKLSLSVLITNCLRINPWHEVQAAVTLAGLLESLRRELAVRFPGTVLLRETRGMTADLGPGTADQLGVIHREGLGALAPGVLAVPSAALAEPVPHPIVQRLLSRLTSDRSLLLDWWRRYLRHLLPPVLHAFARHGVVFEAHLQNVVVGLDPQGLPVQLVLRDLEGVKLVREQRPDDLAAMPEPVRAHVGTPRGRGWDRVGYCLLANHVGGLVSALADRDPGAEPALWAAVHDQLAEAEPFAELEAVLAGEPVPAKTNLLTRWRSAADRDSGYVPLFLPLTADSRT